MFLGCIMTFSGYDTKNKCIYLLLTLKLFTHKFIYFFNLFSVRCQCPAQFEGPECQQNKHSFHGNGYAWFPPLMPCFESHVSLEFITDVADGLLLYSGPLAQLQTWDHEDFMAIGIKCPKPKNMSSLSLVLNRLAWLCLTMVTVL